MNHDRKPDGVVFYSQTLRNASILPDVELGQVVKAVWRFYDTGALPDDLDMAQSIIFDMFRQNVVDAVEKYRETCERNQRIANTRKSHNDSQRVVTGRHGSLPLSPNINTNLVESESKTERKIDRDNQSEINASPYWKDSTKVWLDNFEGRKQE